jgi:hypothetical protein
MIFHRFLTGFGNGLNRALMLDAAELIDRQRALIDLLHGRLREQELSHARSTRDLIEQFLIAHESGTDVRDELLAGLRDLSDQVARMEEHSV